MAPPEARGSALLEGSSKARARAVRAPTRPSSLSSTPRGWRPPVPMERSHLVRVRVRVRVRVGGEG